MELYSAIKTVIELQGKDILKDIRLVNILSDFNAYEEMPASKYLIKNMVNEGLMAKLLMESQTISDVVMLIGSHKRLLSDTYGYKDNLAEYVINSIAFAMGWSSDAPTPNFSSISSQSPSASSPLKPTDDGKPHLSFKQFPITGDVNTFIRQLESIGYVLTEPFSPTYKAAALHGSFAGNNDCSIIVFSTPKTLIARGVMISFGEQQVWYNLKDQYEKVKAQLSKKYGIPKVYEYFLDPYYEGDGYELTALSNDHCSYTSIFEVPDGTISVFLTGEAKVAIMYQDKINTEIGEKEKESLADDDL
jgi:hypothetical protein